MQVDGGVVTLGGRLRSWADKQAVLGAAGHAPGVVRLEDQLRLEPGA